MLGAEQFAAKGTTIFLRRSKTGVPTLSSHTWLGYFKEKTKYLRQKDDSACKKFTNYKGKIDGNFHIVEKYTDLTLPEGTSVYIVERPLRGDTAQGPIVSLASSEATPPGTTTHFTLLLDSDDFEKFAIECLDKGYYNGHGQWRSGGKGRFLYEITDDEGKVIGGNTSMFIGAVSTDNEWYNKFNEFLNDRVL